MKKIACNTGLVMTEVQEVTGVNHGSVGQWLTAAVLMVGLTGLLVPVFPSISYGIILTAVVEVLLCWIVLFLAFGICDYTGFLISALIRYPLINTAVLPALLVASGVSAGTAAAKLLATAVFGEKRDSHAMHILHLAEWPMMAAEISCIFMIAMAMIFGMAGAQAAVTAFTTGVWAAVFWVGAVGVGFGVPFALGMTGCTRSAAGFWTAGFAAVAGMMCLRLFILYAGQLNSLMLTPV